MENIGYSIYSNSLFHRMLPFTVLCAVKVSRFSTSNRNWWREWFGYRVPRGRKSWSLSSQRVSSLRSPPLHLLLAGWWRADRVGEARKCARALMSCSFRCSRKKKIVSTSARKALIFFHFLKNHPLPSPHMPTLKWLQNFKPKCRKGRYIWLTLFDGSSYKIPGWVVLRLRPKCAQ